MFSKTSEYAMIATTIETTGIRVCAHDKDRCDEIVYGPFEYFYEG